VSLFRHTRLSVSGQSAREQSHAGLSHKPFHIVLLLGVALVTIAYDSDRSADQKFEASPQAERGPGPIPLDGPLARPKSLEQIGVPVEATRAVAPADNPQTPEKIALGEKLFFDGRLSVDGTVACSTCHDPARAFTDGRPVSIGVNRRAGQRNAPTILNALYNAMQFWDGRADERAV
jgi:cytochrome c peroxidase